MKYDITLDTFMSMIKQPEFEYKPVKWTFAKHLEEVNLSSSFTLFDDLYEQLGRIPTHQEYLAEGLKRAKQEIENDSRYAWIQWDEQTEGYFKGRLCRSYPSHVVEYHAIVVLKHYWGNKILIGASQHLDGILGVDFVLQSKKTGKLLYAHVLKDSPKALYYLQKKEKRNKFKVGNTWIYFPREFGHSHVNLLWTPYESRSTQVVNGLPLFREFWLGKTLSDAMQESDEYVTDSNNQLNKLAQTLKSCGVEMGNVWVS